MTHTLYFRRKASRVALTETANPIGANPMMILILAVCVIVGTLVGRSVAARFGVN